jgi:hypothetical protein
VSLDVTECAVHSTSFAVFLSKKVKPECLKALTKNTGDKRVSYVTKQGSKQSCPECGHLIKKAADPASVLSALEGDKGETTVSFKDLKRPKCAWPWFGS